MVNSLAARNELVNWQVAPAEWEISNYDHPKMQYREYVQEYIRPMGLKNLRKKTFYTIATNVLCADIDSSKSTIDPIDRDIYLPLEIAIVKWSLADGKNKTETYPLNNKTWMINPGPPTRGCIFVASEHKKKHKIDYNPDDIEQNEHIETDLSKIMKEINSYLSADKIVFSLSTRHMRQDLGSLKWLNRETGYKTKPIKVYSLDDLYVVLINHFNPEMKEVIGLGIARFRLDFSPYNYTELQCNYHKVKSKLADGECSSCAKDLGLSQSQILIDDVIKFGNVFDTVMPTTTKSIVVGG